MDRKYKNNKGITLISLVVTLIVLIILAGVSINLTLGENGILMQAEKAKMEQEVTQIKEMLELKKLEVALLDGNRGNVPINQFVEEIQNDENMLYKVTRSRENR